MWILLFQIAIELTIVFKHYHVYIGNPFPTFVIVMWSCIVLTLVIISIWIVSKNKSKEAEENWNPYNPPIDVKKVK